MLGTPKGLLRRCLWVQTHRSSPGVTGCLGQVYPQTTSKFISFSQSSSHDLLENHGQEVRTCLGDFEIEQLPEFRCGLGPFESSHIFFCFGIWTSSSGNNEANLSRRLKKLTTLQGGTLPSLYCKWSYDPYKWHYKWVPGVLTLLT